jgi:hypothetical protein
MHRICRHTEDGAWRKVAPDDIDTISRRDEPWETLAGRAMDTERFVDDHLKVFQMSHLFESRDIPIGYGFVQLCLELFDNMGISKTVEE